MHCSGSRRPPDYFLQPLHAHDFDVVNFAAGNFPASRKISLSLVGLRWETEYSQRREFSHAFAKCICQSFSRSEFFTFKRAFHFLETHALFTKYLVSRVAVDVQREVERFSSRIHGFRDLRLRRKWTLRRIIPSRPYDRAKIGRVEEKFTARNRLKGI